VNPRTLALAAALAAGACGGPAQPPEAQVRAVLDQAEAAAERRDLSALKALVAEDYADDYGHDRRAITALLRIYLLQHHSIHVLKYVRVVELPGPGRARAVVLAGLSGEPVGDATQLEPARADLLRFTLELRDRGGGEWQVSKAAWERATLKDFL